MPQTAVQPNVQQDFHDLMQSRHDVVQPFDRALSGGGVIAPSNLKWPAPTPSSVVELFDFQRPSSRAGGLTGTAGARNARAARKLGRPSLGAKRKSRSSRRLGATSKAEPREQEYEAVNRQEKAMNEVVIVSAARTPVGAFNGAFANTPAHELGKVAIMAAMGRAKVDPGEVDEVIFGQVLTANTGQNPARQAAMAAGIPAEKTAWALNQLCGSGLRTVAIGM